MAGYAVELNVHAHSIVFSQKNSKRSDPYGLRVWESRALHIFKDRVTNTGLLKLEPFQRDPHQFPCWGRLETPMYNECHELAHALLDVKAVGNLRRRAQEDRTTRLPFLNSGQYIRTEQPLWTWLGVEVHPIVDKQDHKEEHDNGQPTLGWEVAGVLVERPGFLAARQRKSQQEFCVLIALLLEFPKLLLFQPSQLALYNALEFNGPHMLADSIGELWCQKPASHLRLLAVPSNGRMCSQ